MDKADGLRARILRRCPSVLQLSHGAGRARPLHRRLADPDKASAPCVAGSAPRVAWNSPADGVVPGLRDQAGGRIRRKTPALHAPRQLGCATERGRTLCSRRPRSGSSTRTEHVREPENRGGSCGSTLPSSRAWTPRRPDRWATSLLPPGQRRHGPVRGQRGRRQRPVRLARHGRADLPGRRRRRRKARELSWDGADVATG